MVEMGPVKWLKVKGLADKAHVLSLIPRSHMVEGENLTSASCPLTPTTRLWQCSTHTDTCMHK